MDPLLAFCKLQIETCSMPASLPRRSVCPVACTLDLIGDRWTLLVLRDMWAGKQRYSEFLASPEGIATNILSARLAWLVQQGLVRREPPRGRASTYELTKKGESLVPVLTALRDWGLEHIPGTQARVRKQA
jgi:DNA-binding HxlR family transcriptional regulator